MNKPTYEQLEAEVVKLRSKLSFGEDEEFTGELKSGLPSAATLTRNGHNKAGRFTVRPYEMWAMAFPNDVVEPSTRDLAKLGRSLQALGWARSAKRGNLVFTLPIEEYEG